MLRSTPGAAPADGNAVSVSALNCTEDERLRVVSSFGVGMLEDDAELASIVTFAAQLCQAPLAMLSIVEADEQRFLARQGLEERGTPRDISFCSHAIMQSGLLEVSDTSADPRFAAFPHVAGEPGVRFYAGQTLVSREGAPLGTLCVLDMTTRPHGLSALQRSGLAVLAGAAMRRLEARRELTNADEERKQAANRNRYFADAIPALAFTAQPDGTFDYVNRRWREYAGWGEEMLPSAGFPYIHEDDRAATADVWRTAMEQQQGFEAEFRYRRHDGHHRWMLARAQPVKTKGGRTLRWFGTLTDIHDTHQESENRDLLARELSHRIKNIFAVVSSLISISARGKPDVRDFAEDLTQTIAALGRAHDYVRPLEGRKESTLLGLLNGLLAPYCDEAGERVRISGDDRPIGPRAATPLALVFHELATNSAKYGALSQVEGSVEITMEPEPHKECVRIVWQERGDLPEISEGPAGFGSRLVTLAVEGQLDGKIERHFEAGGLRAELTVSIEALSS